VRAEPRVVRGLPSPDELAVWHNDRQFSSDTPTFAHAFLAAGYDTVLSGRMHFVGGDRRHGFNERLIGDVNWNAHLSTGFKLDDVLGELSDTAGMNMAGLIKSGPGRTGYQAYDEAVTRTTVDWLRQRGQTQPGGYAAPFLLTVGYVLPHCPFVAPPDGFDRHRAQMTTDDLPP